MPPNTVCCVFKQVNGKTMDHTGMCIGGGQIIHCSVEVKYGSTTEKGWTHYAIPAGLDGTAPIVKPTLRQGDSGAYVTELQQDLEKLGYSLAPYGADGKFGKVTKSAVIAFQKSKSLAQDGICGPMTWTAIDKALGSSTTQTPATSEKYTVTIPGLTLDQANALVNQYQGASKSKEGG